MKDKPPCAVAIFFWPIFTGQGGHGPLALPPLDQLLIVTLQATRTTGGHGQSNRDRRQKPCKADRPGRNQWNIAIETCQVCCSVRETAADPEILASGGGRNRGINGTLP